MRKLGVFLLGATLCFAFNINHNKVTASADTKTVYLGGMPAGFTLNTGCAQIIGFSEVISVEGVVSPAREAGLKAGDCIMKVAGISVQSVEQLNEIINKSGGKKLSLEIERGEEIFNCTILPKRDKVNNRYKIGVLVRDSVSGIGTVTYIDKENGRFGALGHSIIGENKKEMRISSGNVFSCNIIGVCKGVRGRAGELKGMFLSEQLLGKAEKLCGSGIFGELNAKLEVTDFLKLQASSERAVPGSAYIYSTVSGSCPKQYEIEIVKVDKNNKENKNFVIKIVDDDLIAQTGGIVQGMSGSPIVQEGKLIGAITHVFLNDPTRGYGIDIEKMLIE